MSDFKDMSGAQMVAAYNDLVSRAVEIGLDGYRPVVRFVDKISAIRRYEALESGLRARKDGLMKHDDPPTGGKPGQEQPPAQDAAQEEGDDVAKQKKTSKAKKTSKKVANGHGPRAGTKTEVVAALLRRKSGCTAAEVLEATGWPAVSMPAMAKACGLALRKEKEKGSPTQYYGS